MEKHRFKTAEFAALCGVKKDTLLHYDHIGLLKPQWVGENGYRYYSARQIPTYDLIATLRRLGTPLAEIRSYLTRRSPEALMDLLRGRESINDLSGPVAAGPYGGLPAQRQGQNGAGPDRPAGGDSAGDLSGGPLCGGGGAGFCTCKI